MNADPVGGAPPEFDVLESAGTDVTAPDPDPGDDVRERFAAIGADVALGRLGDLAVWWAQVRSDPAAASPARVVAVGTAPAAPLPAGVGRRGLELPGTLDPVAAPDRAAAIDAAVTWGFALADELADAGVDCVLLAVPVGRDGRALAGYLMGLDPVETNGWPVGPDPDDDTWMDDVEATRDAHWQLRGLRGQPVAMLRAVGDTRLAAATAVLVRSAARRTPVILDGPGAAAAGLLAARCARTAPQWWVAAEASHAPLHQRTLTALGVRPLLRLELTVEDGTAAAAALALLGVAATLLPRA
jgi:nicotinate-nucleotide--dimethylbenzimidazole phosphoribosyltransferase